MPKIAIKLRSSPDSMMHQYAVVISATPPEFSLFQNQFHLNLEMSLAPGGSQIIPNKFSMKILVWNYREANNLAFKRNVLDLITTNNPAILALTETRRGDHDPLLLMLPYSDML